MPTLSSLTVASTPLNDSDVLYVVQAGASRKTPISELVTKVLAALGTMAVQDADSVNVIGGAVNNLTALSTVSGTAVFNSAVSNAWGARVTAAADAVARFAVGAAGADADVAGRLDFAWNDDLEQAQSNAYKNGAFKPWYLDGGPLYLNTLSGADTHIGGSILGNKIKWYPTYETLVVGDGTSDLDPTITWLVKNGRLGLFDIREGPESAWPNRRWVFGMNAGKEFVFESYDDAGASLGTAMMLERNSSALGGLAFIYRTLIISSTAGDEGGELRLTTPSTNTSLAGGYVCQDLWQNRWRLFEFGSPYRGVYVDLTECGAQSKLFHENVYQFLMRADAEVYLGAAGTDGTWVLKRDGNDLAFFRRESGNWVEKQRITA